MKSFIAPPNLVHRPVEFPVSASEPFEILPLHAGYFSVRHVKQEQVVELIWLTKGHFQIMFELETIEVSEGMILFLAPSLAYHIRSAYDLEGLVVRFPAGIIPTDLNSPYPNLSYCISRVFEIDGMTTATIMSVIQCMRQELKDSHGQKMEVLSGYIRIVLLYLLRQRSVVHRSSFKADMSSLAKRFFDLLERRYHVNKKVMDYANELSVTPNYLNQIIKQETGMSASANIRKRLLLQAKRMALVEGVSMKAIAYKLGFEDTAHFSKFFKMGCGCNFTDYRKTCPAGF
ncbi:helix-turn-helix domain-containing protein [Dyadobacter sp. CY345]|uniref:AraC family transcriptional regulator n=1 Tax=Dyadobacter sp. CY345 TaxID=2909335 RepID=UPI001F402E13|nr:helix-turn-helix domain-containing protein [Dyadobacter sp. CY345]MCF2446603.1 helix-turn-helix domain-containing protein [Dyadobacter sp. CY345]